MTKDRRVGDAAHKHNLLEEIGAGRLVVEGVEVAAMNDLEIPMEAIRALCRRYRVAELSLFGSARRGDFRPDSDVDLLVKFEPDVETGLVTLARLQRELAEALRREVDLVPKDGLKPLIRDEVLAEAEVLYAA